MANGRLGRLEMDENEESEFGLIFLQWFNEECSIYTGSVLLTHFLFTLNEARILIYEDI